MGKKNIFSIFLAVLLFFAVAGNAWAKDEKQVKKELTRDEMLVELKDDLADSSDELFEVMPFIKAEKGADGKFTYTCQGVKLDDLSEEELKSLFLKVRQANTKLRTERIQHQLETVRRAQELANSVATSKPQMPAAVPQPPRVPQTPAPAPKPPSPPPEPPSTRR